MMPKRVKFRKSQRGKMKGVANRGNYVAFGEFGLQTTKAGWITARQIEAGRVAAMHFLRREGRVFIRIFPHKPVSGKPLETRMGKGKGAPEGWVCVIKPGRILFEMNGVPASEARRAFQLAGAKLPIMTKFATRFAEEKAS